MHADLSLVIFTVLTQIYKIFYAMANDKWFSDFKRWLGTILDEMIVVYFWDTVQIFASND